MSKHFKRNKNNVLIPNFNFKYQIEVSARLGLKFDPKSQKSKHIGCEILLESNIPQVAWFNDDKTPNKDGAHAQKLAFIEALVSCIHYQDQKGYMNSAANIRDIISRLEKGFARAGASISKEDWDK